MALVHQDSKHAFVLEEIYSRKALIFLTRICACGSMVNDSFVAEYGANGRMSHSSSKWTTLMRLPKLI